jgi:hypothetical protein
MPVQQQRFYPSPMPPNVKVLRIPINTFNGSLEDPNNWRYKMMDELLLRTLISTVRSLGGGPMEQGRIGQALSEHKAIRSYLKEHHGGKSQIHFLSDELSDSCAV